MSGMRWECVSGLPISIAGAAPALDPATVAEAVERRAVPLLWIRGDRLLPIGTGALVTAGRDVLLATAAHVIELAGRVGDLAAPLRDGRVVRFAGARHLAVDSSADVAVILLARGRNTENLRRAWSAVSVAPQDDGWDAPHEDAFCGSHTVAVSGYPAARTRWLDGVLHAKPLTLFARVLQPETEGADRMLAFERVAQRVDGAAIHTPELEGLSGAIAWQLSPCAEPDSPNSSLRAVPLGIQVSYCHGHYIRCRCWSVVMRLARGVSQT